TANLLDPHVAGNSGGVEHTRHHGHRSEEAALAGGAGGAAAYESEKHHHGHGHSNTGATSSGLDSSGPYDNSSRDTAGRDRHLGRDAALGGAGGAAAYEAEKHHHGHGHSNTGATSSGLDSSDPYDNSSQGTTGTGREHHLGRDTALGAGAGGLAYEAERQHGKPTQSSTIPGDATGSAYGNTRDPAGYDQAGTALAGSGHQPATTRHHHTEGVPSQTATAANDSKQPHKHGLFGHNKDKDAAVAGSGDTSQGHHTGRDAALGGAAIGGAGYEAEKIRDPQSSHPGRTAEPIQGSHDPSRDFDPSSNYAHQGSRDATHDRHTGRDAALVGGGAGAGAVAGHEYSEKEAKHLQKEHTKEEKALEKEHSKELKHHDKEVAKHEKAIEKDEKKHEKALEKEEKKQEKEEKKHEHGGEKKHGGLLGLFHREKPDPELKEDEARRQAQLSGNVKSGSYPEEMSAGRGATSRGLERPYGNDSGVNDDPLDRADAEGFGRAAPGGIEGTSGGLAPAGETSLEGDRGMQSGAGSGIGSGMTTHDAYDNDPNKYNKLHKDPPAKVLESRGL
ncbi:hypothetical protein P7C71_g455, partial [Lecanoromycetidae sp. Uapishka_2]